MDVIRTAVSMMGLYDTATGEDATANQARRDQRHFQDQRGRGLLSSLAPGTPTCRQFATHLDAAPLPVPPQRGRALRATPPRTLDVA